MSIYTGTGDQGRTSLFSGERISKSDDAVSAYGDIDELNSFVGFLRSQLPISQNELHEEIMAIQKQLFRGGAWLATRPGAPATTELPKMTAAESDILETAIDRMEAALPPIKSFILPGGSHSAAAAHMARTVCRRAERSIVKIAKEASGDEYGEQIRLLQTYLNRLSDYLFMVARCCNHFTHREENEWLP